jgi:RNA polymerase primary sigma factor
MEFFASSAIPENSARNVLLPFTPDDITTPNERFERFRSGRKSPSRHVARMITPMKMINSTKIGNDSPASKPKKSADAQSSVATKGRKPASEKKTVAAAKKPKSSKSTLPNTFSCEAVEKSFVHYCQLVTAARKSPEDIRTAVKTVLSQEIDFMGHADFTAESASEVIFHDGQLIPGATEESLRVRTPDLPSHLARLCETKLLTPEEEYDVFRKMNFLRFRANQLRSELSLDADVSAESLDWTIRRIETLLRAADWYRDRMVKSNMRLVISIVKKFVNIQNGFDDLLSDGIIALLRAVDKFDVGLGFRFSTYATQVVRRNTYRRVMDKQKERQRITLSVHDSGIDISDEHRTAGMSEAKWEALRGKLSTMLDQLDRREKLIIRARFSLGGHRRVQTLQKLADRLGVSKERVRQLEKRALDKLRGFAEVSPLPEMDA